MKIKYLLILACGLMLFSCTTEETDQILNDDLQLTTDTNQDSNSGRNFNGGGTPCPPVTCDPNFNFPAPNLFGCYNDINITYSPMLDVSEIPCIRQEYFECFRELDLRFPPIQSLNPYEEVWQLSCAEPDGGLNTTICNDPRTNTECEE